MVMLWIMVSVRVKVFISFASFLGFILHARSKVLFAIFYRVLQSLRF